MTRQSDPARLVRSETHAGRLLRDYAKGTTRRVRDLEGETDSAPASLLEGLRRAFSPSRVLTLAVGLFVLVKLAPLLPRLDAARASGIEASAFGGSGGGSEGAGGTEGSGG